MARVVSTLPKRLWRTVTSCGVVQVVCQVLSLFDACSNVPRVLLLSIGFLPVTVLFNCLIVVRSLALDAPRVKRS